MCSLISTAFKHCSFSHTYRSLKTLAAPPPATRGYVKNIFRPKGTAGSSRHEQNSRYSRYSRNSICSLVRSSGNGCCSVNSRDSANRLCSANSLCSANRDSASSICSANRDSANSICSANSRDSASSICSANSRDSASSICSVNRDSANSLCSANSRDSANSLCSVNRDSVSSCSVNSRSSKSSVASRVVYKLSDFPNSSSQQVVSVSTLAEISRCTKVSRNSKVSKNSSRIVSSSLSVLQAGIVSEIVSSSRMVRNSARFKSTAALLRNSGLAEKEREISQQVEQVTVVYSDANEDQFRSQEALVLHHSRAETVLEMTHSATHASYTTCNTADTTRSAANATHSSANASDEGRSSVVNSSATMEIFVSEKELLRMCSVAKPQEQQPTTFLVHTNRAHQPLNRLPPPNYRPQTVRLSDLPTIYASLSKSRLTGLVVLTAVGGYMMAPGPLGTGTLLATVVGVALVSAGANATNQVLEAPYDSQMDRTKNRCLVQGLLTPLHAATFATLCSCVGLATLCVGVGALPAVVASVNLFLYTCVYTPTKRLSVINTWLGAVVGALPPLIGWASSAGGLSSAGAWVLSAILYTWQFPHFNSLSWNLRPDYSRAGYRMMAVTDPGLCLRVSLRHSVAMVGICWMAPVLGVTTWTFAVDSTPVNIYLVYLAWRFYKDSDSKSSRKLFLYTLIHLPVVMMLMIISKNRGNTAHIGDTAADVGSAAGGLGSTGSGSADFGSTGSGSADVGSTVGSSGAGIGSTAGDIGAGISSTASDIGAGIVSTAGNIGAGIGSTASDIGAGVGSAVSGVSTDIGSTAAKIGSTDKNK